MEVKTDSDNDATLRRLEHLIDISRNMKQMTLLLSLFSLVNCLRNRSSHAFHTITWLLVVPMVFINATPSGNIATENQSLGNNTNIPINLSLKIDAAQKEINQLILVLNKTDRPNVSNIIARPEIPATGNFTRPPFNSKTVELENEIKRMKEDIRKLLESGNLAEGDKVRLASLESSVEELQKILDKQRQYFTEQTDELKKMIQALVETIQILMKDLNNLKDQAAQEESKSKPEQCIAAIKSHDFETAERKLQEITDDTTINLIVNRVYEYQQSNFDLVLRFGDSIRDKRRSLLVFKALNYEMASNGHRDAAKMIKLVEILRTGIINQQSTSSQLKTQAQAFENELINAIKPVMKEKLKNGMLNNNYESNYEITMLSNSVYRISAALFRDLLTEVVNEIYGRIDTKALLMRINSHTFLGQRIPGYAAVFAKIRRSNNDSIFSLAYYVKNAIESFDYAGLDDNSKSTLTNIKNSLPVSVRNIVFSSKVCIVNVKYPKNLYASGKYLHDRPRRHVFTAMPGNNEVRHQEDHWQLIRENDYFYIFNVAHREFMYSPSDYKDFKQGKDRRKVFTWTAGSSFDSCRWYIEPLGDHVEIKSVERSEYLYTSNRYKHKRSNQKMFTWIPRNKVANGLWSVVDCSHA